MKKITAVLLMVAMSVMALAACGSSSGSSSASGSAASAETTGVEGGTVVLQIYGDPMSFNPDLNSDDNFYGAAQNIFSRLTALDADSNVVPDLAESWEYSEDGKTLTYHLHENAKWHDGENVTADDVVYTFTYIKDNEDAIMHYSLSNVDSIVADDDYTVTFNLIEPDLSLVANLSWYGTFVLPEHIYNNGESWSESSVSSADPIGSGAFKFESYTRGENMKLTRNDDYFNGAPSLDGLVYSIIPDDATALQSLLNGEVDWVTSVPSNMVSSVEGNSDVRLELNSLPSPTRIVFNLEKDGVNDVAVRTAIAMCINREDISEKATSGIMPVEYSVIPSSIWASNTEDTYPAYDIDGAIKVLEDAGYTKNSDGYYVTGITLVAFDVAPYPDAAKLIIDSCKQAGIEITLSTLEYNAWADVVENTGEFDIEIQGGFMGPDPSAINARFVPGGWANVGSYDNETVTDLLTKALSETDETARKELYDEAQKIITEDLPLINIMEYAAYEGVNAKLQNTPMQGAGQWGWADWSHAYFTE